MLKIAYGLIGIAAAIGTIRLAPPAFNSYQMYRAERAVARQMLEQEQNVKLLQDFAVSQQIVRDQLRTGDKALANHDISEIVGLLAVLDNGTPEQFKSAIEIIKFFAPEIARTSYNASRDGSFYDVLVSKMTDQIKTNQNAKLRQDFAEIIYRASNPTAEFER